jgi:DNA-binding MarR family transcriptional regulator
VSAAGRERQGLRLRTRWIIGLRLSDLEPMTTLVAHTLASWANADGLGARPSVSSIAKGCRLKKRAVTDHIKKLDDAGLIRRTHGRGVPNRYSLLIPTEIEVLIEAQLGEWTEEVGHGDALVGGEVGHLDAPSTAPGRTKYGTPVPTSLTEPYKEQPTSAIDPRSGSPTPGTPSKSGDAPWKGYCGGWPAWLKDEDQKRSEEEAATQAREAAI